MSAKRGRTAGFEMSSEHRVKIKNSNILNCLIGHAEGKRNMSATQVTAGLGLLRKVMPDLSQSEVTHNHNGVELTDQEIIARLVEIQAKDKDSQVQAVDNTKH